MDTIVFLLSTLYFLGKFLGTFAKTTMEVEQELKASSSSNTAEDTAEAVNLENARELQTLIRQLLIESHDLWMKGHELERVKELEERAEDSKVLLRRMLRLEEPSQEMNEEEFNRIDQKIELKKLEIYFLNKKLKRAIKYNQQAKYERYRVRKNKFEMEKKQLEWKLLRGRRIIREWNSPQDIDL